MCFCYVSFGHVLFLEKDLTRRLLKVRQISASWLVPSQVSYYRGKLVCRADSSRSVSLRQDMEELPAFDIT